MAKKYPRSEQLRQASLADTEAYVSWSPSDGPSKEALTSMSGAVQEYVSIPRMKSSGRWHQDLSDLDTNISGRPGLSKSDYYAFRPHEAPRLNIKGQISDAEWAYSEVGLIRNIIDLMADFACQGIRLVHPNPKIQKFYQNWFARVNGKDRSERFLNNLYRTGNVIIRKQTAKIKQKSRRSIFKSVANPETTIDEMVVKKNEIPWKYTFLNPLFIDVVGGSLASFVGSPAYAIKLPRNITKVIKSPRSEEEKKLVSQLPEEIVRAAKTNKPIMLPGDKTSVFHYKKDDWQGWASPMIHAIMDDIAVLEKLRLADMAALDGAISNIRIFKIGSLEHQIAPTQVAASRLAELLESNVGGGTMDLVWGPDIELIESKTAVHQFLGSEKYQPHLNAIYAGLGIPPTLTGTAGSSGTTNNLISLKTLIGRLEYGRNVLMSFWEREIEEVRKAMGFRFPAKVEFTRSNLGDEAAEKALLIQLADRNLVSDEMLQRLFENDPELEKVRINRETRERNQGKHVPKSGPFHDPQFGIALKKVALQSGVVSPGQVGLRKDAKTRDLKMYDAENGEQPALKMRQPTNGKPRGPQKEGKKGEPQQGRPRNSKDKQKRKQRNPLETKTRASIEIWARYAQTAIAEYLNPIILDKFNKKNLRSLTLEESDAAEKIKFGVLCNLEPLQKIEDEDIFRALSGEVPSYMYDTYCQWSQAIKDDVKRKLTLDELKHVQACVYASYTGD